MKLITQLAFSVSFIQYCDKNCDCTDSFITRCQCGNCQSMWREEENICCQEVDAVKNKILEAVTMEELQAEPRCIVQHPGFDTPSPHTFISWKLVKAESVCSDVLLQNITTQRFPGFCFLRFKSCCFPSIS